MAGNDPLRGALALPFKEQVEFFAQKINLPTAHWDDIRQGAHDRAFVVAGAMKADLLADLKQSIARHMDGGLGLEGYRRDFYAIIQQYGWQGFTGDDRKKPSDPKDKGGAGMAWRTRVTYMTNLRTSYAAGRYQQLKESPSLRYWMWKHDPLVTEARAQHLAWDGMILPADHPFWKLHYPPQIPPHWGCRCRVVGVETPDDAVALGGDPDKPLPQGWEAIDAAHKTQAPGWDYAPGAHTVMPLAEMVNKKLLGAPASIGAALWDELKDSLGLEQQGLWWRTLDAWQADPLPRGRSAVLGVLSPAQLAAIKAAGREAPGAAALTIADSVVVGRKQRRHENRQDGLLPEEWRALPQWLNDAALYEADNGHLIFVANGIGPAKMAVELSASADAAGSVVSAYRATALDVAGMVGGGRWRIVKP